MKNKQDDASSPDSETEDTTRMRTQLTYHACEQRMKWATVIEVSLLIFVMISVSLEVKATPPGFATVVGSLKYR